MYEPTGATNISQVHYNEPFKEYNGDDYSQGNYPILNMQAVISLLKTILLYLGQVTYIQVQPFWINYLAS